MSGHAGIGPAPGRNPDAAAVDRDGFGRSYHSFSGADIHVTFHVPSEFLPISSPGLRFLDPNQLLEGAPGAYDFIGDSRGLLLVGNLQTLTISSARSVAPVRRLGEAQAHHYTAGARTIAGSMVFSMLYRNAFYEIYRRAVSENVHESFFVDMLPPFTIIVNAENEAGYRGRQIISGVKLVNTGVTYSVDDLYTEETFSYVARDASPFIPQENHQEFLQALTRSTAAAQNLPQAPVSASSLPFGAQDSRSRTLNR